MRTLAIGDIHGSYEALRTLLTQLNPEEDQLVFLGDYIDRGPHSRQVIETLVELAANPNHVFLRGNHDEWLLRARSDEGWFSSWLSGSVGGKTTLQSYGASTFDHSTLSLIPRAHFDFLDETLFCFQTECEIFVHASLSQLPPEQNG